MLFTLGLQVRSYYLLLIGRLVFGLSDSVSIFQHTILCYWFDAKSLPYVFGILLFLVKVVRAINDNIASVFYNATGSLPAYFWLGFVVSLTSLVSAFYLTTIHESVSETKLGSTAYLKKDDNTDEERQSMVHNNEKSD